MLDSRKLTLLKALIKEYLKTAQPVSSGMLAKTSRIGVSSATIRNEMAELEEAGYIVQPHTSSGRIPTESAYELWLADLRDNPPRLKSSEEAQLDQLFSKDEETYRALAKQMAELSNNAVFWAFSKNNVYHTGLANLFSHPEFKQLEAVYDISVIIDQLEEIIAQIFERLDYREHVLIGSKNPFGSFLSTVLVKYRDQNTIGVFGLIGPLRMDYDRNLALVSYLKNKFNC
ncbi:HTH domain-containing protein [Candidatus Falkowbacteria bacterium]|jgi:heat-inducible transcriptional repressor|nr:HTH domain-containing protein [Patescibacteria group bacterium]MDD3435052.1 HTH domain-containing protein [Patescibacteria group bacterium]NCU42819.1 HTH domain-containing protein [Candidatus Falkowbacteria bacterium]